MLEMSNRITTIEEFAELRRYDARPIWESLSAEIDRLRSGQEEMRAGQEKLVAEVAALRAGQEVLRAGQEELRAGQMAIKEELGRTNQHLKRIDGKLLTAFGDVGELRADVKVRYAEYDDRFAKLESTVS